jgi:mevalonate kinase
MQKFSSYAKWILSGEHAVIRGGKALAFPLRCYQNSIFFEKSKEFLINLRFNNLKNMVAPLFEIASDFAEIPLAKICGCYTIKSNIPVKMGLGSSAAICANIANIFKYHGYEGEILSLAKRLEDKFHKKSSGLDVAVALKNQAIVFENNKIINSLQPAFWPYLILTYCGKKSSTAYCTTVVQEIFLKNEKLAHELDTLMNQSANMCESAFKTADFGKLRDGIMLGNEVFQRWGLYGDLLKSHVNDLTTAGAVAAKPIGSGLGGYVVSLWHEKPKRDIYLTLEKP